MTRQGPQPCRPAAIHATTRNAPMMATLQRAAEKARPSSRDTPCGILRGDGRRDRAPNAGGLMDVAMVWAASIRTL